MKKNFKVIAKSYGKEYINYFENYNDVMGSLTKGGITIWNSESFEIYVKNREDGRKWDKMQKIEMTRNW